MSFCIDLPQQSKTFLLSSFFSLIKCGEKRNEEMLLFFAIRYTFDLGSCCACLFALRLFIVDKAVLALHFLVACYATLHPALSVRPSVHWSIHQSVHHTLLFLFFCGLWPHCSCPNDQVTSNTTPAHPHATGVAMYPALFNKMI